MKRALILIGFLLNSSKYEEPNHTTNNIIRKTGFSTKMKYYYLNTGHTYGHSRWTLVGIKLTGK